MRGSKKTQHFSLAGGGGGGGPKSNRVTREGGSENFFGNFITCMGIY